MPSYRLLIRILLLCLLMAVPTLAQEPEENTYVIQPGDTLISIAQRFNTTVTAIMQENGIVNRSLIYYGQRIRIPQPDQSDSEAQPTETPPQATTEHIVQPNEQLNRIALLYHTTISELIRLNPQIANPNIIYAGQHLIVPAEAVESTPQEPTEVLPTVAPTEIPPTAVPTEIAPTEIRPTILPPTALPPTDFPTALPVIITATPGTASATTDTTSMVTAEVTAEPMENIPATFGYGIDVNIADGTSAEQMATLDRLGFDWVKQEIQWRNFETAPGEIDFDALDTIITTLEARQMNILLTVTYAPDWARSIQEENGPPDNFANYGSFISALATRYKGRVQAYEIWNEPNLRSRWKSPLHPIGAVTYIDLLRHGYNAVKAADPTGFNDARDAEAGDLEVNAIDDRVFLRDLYAAGVSELVDGIGAHPMGWANPPDARCCEAAPGVSTHFEDEHFYFLNTLESYRQIMLDNGDESTPVWVTKFGWGTYEGVAEAPTDPFSIFISYLNQSQQALYANHAFEIGQSLGYIGPMFLYNFNACTDASLFDSTGCFYSLTDTSGSPRPAFAALAARSQPQATLPTELATEEATSEVGQ